MLAFKDVYYKTLRVARDPNLTVVGSIKWSAIKLGIFKTGSEELSSLLSF